MPRGVLFDVGYCLMDESARLDHALAWLSNALFEAGRPLGADRLHDAYGAACRAPEPGEPSLLAQMLRTLGVPAAQARALRARLPWDATPLDAYPDTLPALRTLREAGFRVGVLANQPASAEAELERAGITALCDGVWLSGAAGRQKPDPAFFALALDAWGLPPVGVAYVGDRPDQDVAPARALGLLAVRLRRGPHAEQPGRGDGQQADLDVSSLSEAASRLVAWRGGLVTEG